MGILLLLAMLAQNDAAPSLAAGADAFAPYANQPVLSVDITAPPGNDAAALRGLIDVQPGYLLAQDDVAAAIKRLYALGRFSQVEVFAERQSGVVLLHFVVHPLRRLDDIDVSGTLHTSSSDLRAALKMTRNDEVDTRSEARIKARALGFLQRSGYPDAQVDVRRSDVPDTGEISFKVRVEEGEPRRVGHLAITGTPRLPERWIKETLHLRDGSVLDLNALEQDRKALRQMYYDHGFLNASIRTAVSGDEDAEVTVEVTAGDRISLEFTGNEVFSAIALRRQWPDPSGPAHSSNLHIFRQRIVNQYIRQGYPNVKVEMRGYRDAETGIRRYLFKIDEKQPLQITAIQFVGATALPHDLLVEQVRATLRRELTNDDVFTPLTDGELRTAGPRSYGDAPKAPSVQVSAGERWVPELYQSAVDQIAAAYRDAGYLNVEIGVPTLVGDCPKRPGHTACRLTAEIQVHEGSQMFVDSMAFAGNAAFPASELLDVVYNATAHRELSAPVSPGNPLSQNGVEDGRIEIIRHYREQGYLYARVFTHVDIQPNSVWGSVHYSIEEGPQVRLQRILIRGNQYTREGIIRSRIGMQSGDLYRLEQALADQRSISSLGVFSSVRVKLIDEEHPSERKDVVADLVERNRQPIEIAPGLSTAYGPRLQASYSHLNVGGTASAFTATLKLNRQIFFGFYGQYASLLTQRYAGYVGIEQLTKALEREVRLGLRSPPIRALPFDPVLRVDLVDQRVNAVRYSFDSETAIFGIDLHLPAHFKSSLEAQVGLINLECEESIDPNCNENPDLRRLQSVPIDVGQRWTLKGGPLVVWDFRDSPINPSRGIFTSARFTYAIGEASPGHNVPYEPFAFAKYEVNVTGYIPLWGAILALAARGGTIHLVQSQVPIDERFFMGGRDTLRGFIESTLIPQDACVGTSQPPPWCHEQIAPTPGSPPLSRGGNTFLLLKTELRLPLRDALYFDIFADVGNLWIDIWEVPILAFRIGTGVGLRYATPVGALAIDFGINPLPKLQYGEPYWQVHFSIGAF